MQVSDRARGGPAKPPDTDGAKSQREARRQHHQQVSRVQLLDGAEEIFGRKGFHQTSLKEVAELAEFSVGSVYTFFENKDDLFRQVFIRRGAEFMPAMRAILTDGAPPVEQLRRLVEFQVTFFHDRPHFGRLFLQYSSPVNMSSLRPVDDAITANYEEAMALQADLIRRGQETGEFRRGSPETLARLLSGLVAAYQAVDPAIVADDPTSAHRLPVSDLGQIVWAAFASPAPSPSTPDRSRSGSPLRGTTTRD
jgi:AcrR family transcriptional regulator